MLMSTLLYIPKSSNMPMSILMRILDFVYIYEGAHEISDFGMLMRMLDFGMKVLMSMPDFGILMSTLVYIPKSSNMLDFGIYIYHIISTILYHTIP